MKIIQHSGVEAGNLFSFLAQDKVVESSAPSTIRIHFPLFGESKKFLISSQVKSSVSVAVRKGMADPIPKKLCSNSSCVLARRKKVEVGGWSSARRCAKRFTSSVLLHSIRISSRMQNAVRMAYPLPLSPTTATWWLLSFRSSLSRSSCNARARPTKCLFLEGRVLDACFRAMIFSQIVCDVVSWRAWKRISRH